MKLRSMTVTATMSNQCEARDGSVKRRKRSSVGAEPGLSSGSETSIVCNFNKTKTLTMPDCSSLNQFDQLKETVSEVSLEGGADQFKKSKSKRGSKKRQSDIVCVKKTSSPKAMDNASNKSTSLNESTDIPEIIIDDFSPTGCSQAADTGVKKRKSLNESIVILGEVNRQEPPKKRKRIQEPSSSDTVINLCDDDSSIVEIDCATPAEDIIYLDSSRSATQESPLPVRGKKRNRTCTVVSNSPPKYNSLLTMLQPSSSAVTDNTVSSTSSASSFTVDKSGWHYLKQALKYRKSNRRVDKRPRNYYGNQPPDSSNLFSSAQSADGSNVVTSVQTADGSNPFGSNIFNPNPQIPKPSGALRPIVIDGSNVAVGHSHGARLFSCRGLQICIKYFAQRGHEVKAFVPQFRKHDHNVTDRHIFDELENAGQIVFTPSRRVDGKLFVPYDDRYIVQYAAEVGGVIVSTDNFRDLLYENAAWRDTIENRLLMFTWVGDLLMFPMDPLGRHGPKLDEFLRFPL